MIQEREASPELLSQQALAAIREFFSALALVIHMCRLYSAEHALVTSSFERVLTTFRAATKETDEIDFTVESDCFHVAQQSVYRSPGGSECPVVALYREGVRRVRIMASATKEEIFQFTALLAREIPAGSLEDDLVTLLWEADFASITYQLAAEQSLEQQHTEPNAPGVLDDGEEGDSSVGVTPSCSWQEASLEEVVGMVELRARLLDLYGRDRAAAPQEIEWEGQPLPEEQMERILRAVLADESDPNIAGVAAARSVDLVFFLTQAGALANAARVLSFLVQAGERAGDAPCREAVRREIGRLASEDYARCFKEALATGNPDDATLAELMRLMPSEALARLAPEAAILADKYPLLWIYRELAPSHLTDLYRLLHRTESETLAFLLAVLDATADKGVLSHLGAALHTERVDVRLRALALVRKFAGEPRVPDLLVPLLSDRVPAVRLQAVEQLAMSRSQRAMSALWDMVSNQSFEEGTAEEKKTLLESIAVSARDEAVPLLRSILDRRKLFGGAKQRESQEAALAALERTDSPLAGETLRYYADKGPRWMKAVCQAALAEKSRAEGA